MKIRIVVADALMMFRDALCCIIETESDMLVVGQAASAREALNKVSGLRPDILLLDLSTPEFSGLEVLRTLKEGTSPVRTLGFMDGPTNGNVVTALKHGAHGILQKRMTPALLLKSIRSVSKGEYWIGHDNVIGLVDAIRSAPAPPVEITRTNGCRLTPREMEIVTAIVDGATNKDIARKLSISEQTVKHHLTNIYGKAGVSNRLELALFAMHDATGTFR